MKNIGFWAMVALCLAACGEAVPQNLGNIRVTTPMYTAEGVDDIVSNVVAGIVADKITDGTNIIDAAGLVWQVTSTNAYMDWHITTNGAPCKTLSWDGEHWADSNTQMWYYDDSWFFSGPWIDGSYIGSADILSFTVETYIESYGSFVRAEVGFSRDSAYTYKTNLVGRIALTNDIPTVDYTTSNTQLVATIETTAPAPGNYSAVSNAAMNARSMTDLGVRGEPQSEGSYFLVNDEIVGWVGDHEDPTDDGWYGIAHISLLADSYYEFSTGGNSTNFMLHGEDYTATLNVGGETYYIQGFAGTLAQVSQIPDVSGKLDSVAAFPAWDAGTSIYLAGTIVSYGGRLWRTDDDILDSVPPPSDESVYWAEVTVQKLLAVKQDSLSPTQIDYINDVPNKASTQDLARATSQMWIDTSTSPATTNFNQNFVPLYHKQGSDLDTVVGNGYYGDEADTIRVYNTAYGILLKDPSQTTYSRAEANPNAMWGSILDPIGFSFNRGASQAPVYYSSWSAGDSGDSVSEKTTNYIVPWLDLMRVSQPLPTVVRPTITNGKISNEEAYIKTPVSSRALYRGLRSTWVNGHRLYSEGERTEDLEYHYYTTIYGTDIPQSTNSPDISVGTRLANVLDDRVVLSSNSWRQTDGAYVMKPIAFNRFSNAVLWGDHDVSRYILLYQNSTYHYLTQMPENSPSEFSVATCAGTIDSKELDFGEYGKFRRTPLTETETIHSIYSDQLSEVVDGIASDVTDGRLKVKQIFTEDGQTYLDATGVLHRITVTGGNSLTMSNAVGIAGYTVTYTNIPNAQIPAFQVENAAGTYESAVRDSFGLVAWSSAQSKWLGFSERTTLSYLITNYGEDLSGALSSNFTSINVTSPLTTEFEFGMSPAYWPCYIPQGETTTSIVNTVLFSKSDAKIDGSLSVGHGSALATNLYSFASGTNVIAGGIASHAEGDRTLAQGTASHAEGIATRALGDGSHSSGINTHVTQRATFAAGVNVSGTNSLCFIWNGNETYPWYGTHGKGTFNINPAGGLAGFYVGSQNLAAVFYNSITSAPPTLTTIEYEKEDGTTSTVTTNLPSLREAVEQVAMAAVMKPSDPLCGWSLPEYVSALQKYEWDPKAQVCYRREVTNDYIILKAVTNIDLTAAGNITALKAYEDSILVRKPPQVTGGYTVGYPSDSDKIVVSGGDYKLEGDYLDGASVKITYEVSGTPTTETIPDSAITTTADTITIASSALANARSNGGTVTFSIQTAYGSTTATAVVASISP